jgi:hypothetical protein
MDVPNYPQHGLFSFEVLAAPADGAKDFYVLTQITKVEPGWYSSQPIVYSLAGMFKDVVNKTEARVCAQTEGTESGQKQQNIVIQGHTGIRGSSVVPAT